MPSFKRSHFSITQPGQQTELELFIWLNGNETENKLMNIITVLTFNESFPHSHSRKHITEFDEMT